jgi:hypothetical protein
MYVDLHFPVLGESLPSDHGCDPYGLGATHKHWVLSWGADCEVLRPGLVGKDQSGAEAMMDIMNDRS